MKSRIIRFEEQLNQFNLDAFLVTGQNNIYYLTGFWGTSATVLITKHQRIFMTDARYTLLAKETVRDFDIIETRQPLSEVKTILSQNKYKKVGFDEEVSYAFYRQLEALSSDILWSAQKQFVEKLRLIKDREEIETIRQACAISDKAFMEALDFIKPGETTENDVANFLDFKMREYGASGISFETIIASGYRSAMPHGVASDKIIKQGESVTFDFGCYYNHYVSDMTRTIHIGEVTDEERQIYDIVLNANQRLIENAKAGISLRDYDGIARQILIDSGYGDFFTHGIGHSIGLDIHENPFFGNSDDKLQTGMVVTDEPGLYLPNKYGVRIEDDLLITDDGCEVFTKSPKEIIVLK